MRVGNYSSVTQSLELIENDITYELRGFSDISSFFFGGNINTSFEIYKDGKKLTRNFALLNLIKALQTDKPYMEVMISLLAKTYPEIYY